jgi:hypothetical protein
MKYTGIKNKKSKMTVIIAALICVAMICAAFLPTFAAATTVAAAADSPARSSTRSAARAPAPIKYPETDGVVSLTLMVMNSRIPADNEDYKVSQKRVDIYQRRLSDALHDKYLAENKDAPQPVFSAQRVAHEKQLYTDWRNTELELERYQNDLKVKLDKIKSGYKKQYTDILDLGRGLSAYQDDLVKLDKNIGQLNAQIKVGVAKASDLDVYNVQKVKLEADIAAKQRDIDLAKYNLKLDLKIDQGKDLFLADFNEKFVRFDDSGLEKLIRNSVDKCFSVNSNVKKLEILKDERAIMLQWDREGAMLTNLQNNEISIKEAEYAVINAKNTEESSLWADYYSLLNQEDQIEIERLSLKVAENDYAVVTVKLNQGLVKPLDELISHMVLENAEKALQTAINNYVRMSEDYQVRLAN